MTTNSSPPNADGGIAVANDSSESLGYVDEKFVAGAVSMGVVELFEPVEIDVAHADMPALSFDAREGAGQGR